MPDVPLTQLVGPDHRVNFGVTHQPLDRCELHRARFSWKGLPVPTPLRRFRLKEWQHFGVFLGRDRLLTTAVVDVKYLGLGWIQVADLDGARRFEHHTRGPLVDVRCADALWDDHSHLRTRGLSIQIRNHLDRSRHVIELQAARTTGKPAVRAHLVCDHDLDQVDPLVVSLPVGPGRTMYSHKVPLPCHGWIEIDGAREDVTDAVALLDIHKAHYPHHTFWRWATFGGRDDAGRVLGLNLTRNVVTDDDRYNENAVWIDGRITRLGPARFEPGPEGAPWRVGSRDGRVDLTFHPAGGRSEDLDVGPVRSRFQQLYGRFEGTITLEGGETVDVPGLVGLCEDHDSLW